MEVEARATLKAHAAETEEAVDHFLLSKDQIFGEISLFGFSLILIQKEPCLCIYLSYLLNHTD